MKKIIALFIILAFSVGIYFGFGYVADKNIIDDSHWKIYGNSEFTVILPT